MNEIEDILATASEPLPRVERIDTPETPPAPKFKPAEPDVLPPSSATKETTMNAPEPDTLPRPEPQTSRPAPVPSTMLALPEPLDGGDNPMETILRVMAMLSLVGGIGYSIYLAAEIANMGRRFGGDGATGVLIFIIGTLTSLLVFSALFVLSNISVNTRTSKHLLAQLVRNSAKAAQ